MPWSKGRGNRGGVAQLGGCRPIGILAGLPELPAVGVLPNLCSGEGERGFKCKWLE